jgi:hypothetical protein
VGEDEQGGITKLESLGDDPEGDIVHTAALVTRRQADTEKAELAHTPGQIYRELVAVSVDSKCESPASGQIPVDKTGITSIIMIIQRADVHTVNRWSYNN